MALAGILANLDGELEAEVSADNQAGVICEAKDATKNIFKGDQKESKNALYHFKLTQTHTIEGEYKKKVDFSKTVDEETGETEEKSESRKCCCFAFLRGRVKR